MRSLTLALFALLTAVAAPAAAQGRDTRIDRTGLPRDVAREATRLFNETAAMRSTGRVEITSQNHGFAVDADSLERVGGVVTHVNLNDGSLEGFIHAEKQAFAVQFHPEASPGPHDSGYLFERFVDTVRFKQSITLDTLKHA